MDFSSVREEILEKEKEKKITRILTFENLLRVYDRDFSKFHAQLTEKKLFIPKKHTKIVYEEPLVKPTEIIRYLLELELDKFNIKKIRYRNDFKSASQLYFPYKFSTGEFKGNFFKIDIKACFYSIYSVIGIDANCLAEIDFEQKVIDIRYCGKGILDKRNSKIIQELQNLKQYRNIAYGLTRASWYIALFGKKRERKYFRGRLQNLDLTVIISSILHSFVHTFYDAIIYWNIDGGIIHAEKYELMRQYLNENFGLELRKEFDSDYAIILGLGSYAIGEYATEHFKNGICSYQNSVSYVFEVRNIQKIISIFQKWR